MMPPAHLQARTSPEHGPILLSPPHLSGEEEQLLLKAMASNWIAPIGPDLEAFERELATRVETSEAVGLASGTAALHLALQIVGVRPGDQVLCSTFTFAASANPILYCGAEPVFIDSSEQTWNMDPNLLDAELRRMAARGRLPRAVIVVDLYGQCADYDPILSSCAEFKIPVICDAAESLGASYKGRPAGSLGEISIVSFNGNKILTCSGGGALLSANPAHAERARFLATQARDPAPHYQHSVVGYNYRLSNLLAAIGRGQLRVLEDRVAARRAVRERYKTELAGIPGIHFAPEAAYGESNGWLTCIVVDEDVFGASNEDIRKHLESLRVESRPLWKPMHEQPIFEKYPCVGGETSASLFRKGLCLPSGSALTEEEVTWVASEIAACRKSPGRVQVSGRAA